MKYLFWSLIISAVVFRLFNARSVYSEGDKVRVSTRIVSEPVRYDYSQTVKLRGLYARLPAFPELSYGDTVVVEGVVAGRELTEANLVVIKKSDGFFYELRKKIIRNFKSFLPSPHGALLAGILLGSRNSFSQEFWTDVQIAGLSHIIVASGTNISFVALFMYRMLFLFFRRKIAMCFVILSIILYIVLAGADAPLIRAGIMAGILVLGQLTGRVVKTWNVLVIAALLMIIIKPEWIEDLGFQLSLAATGSLVLFENKIRKKLKAIPSFFRESASTSFSAQIGTAPILFVTFGYFNILSLPSNLLVMWTIPIIMPIAALGAVTGIISPVLGKLVVSLSYPLTWWFNSVVEIFS